MVSQRRYNIIFRGKCGQVDIKFMVTNHVAKFPVRYSIFQNYDEKLVRSAHTI